MAHAGVSLPTLRVSTRTHAHAHAHTHAHAHAQPHNRTTHNRTTHNRTTHNRTTHNRTTHNRTTPQDGRARGWPCTRMAVQWVVGLLGCGVVGWGCGSRVVGLWGCWVVGLLGCGVGPCRIRRAHEAVGNVKSFNNHSGSRGLPCLAEGICWATGSSRTTPFTEGRLGVNDEASPPGRHQEQAPKQRCTFSSTTFSSVQFSAMMLLTVSVQCVLNLLVFL